MLFVEYIWLDAKGSFRSKTRVMHNFLGVPREVSTILKHIPLWHFDGSSTGQACLGSSDVVLVPAQIYRNPFKIDDLWVLCEVETVDKKGLSSRREAAKSFEVFGEALEPWFGFEQEFFILKDDPSTTEPHYCGVGYPQVLYRPFLEEAVSHGLSMGLQLDGFNLEVAPHQLEIQLLGKGLKAADDLTILRYLLLRLGERHSLAISFHPKPFADTNGSGCHTNISTLQTRGGGDGYAWIVHFIEKALGPDHEAFMTEVSGEANEKRMTGTCETSSFKDFSWAEAHRGSSVRIPEPTVRLGHGYFEDRRPGSSVDPYDLIGRLTRLMGESIDSFDPEMLSKGFSYRTEE